MNLLFTIVILIGLFFSLITSYVYAATPGQASVQGWWAGITLICTILIIFWAHHYKETGNLL